MHYPLERDIPVDSVTQGFEKLDPGLVQRPISANPGLNFNLGFDQKHQIVGKKNFKTELPLKLSHLNSNFALVYTGQN